MNIVPTLRIMQEDMPVFYSDALNNPKKVIDILSVLIPKEERYKERVVVLYLNKALKIKGIFTFDGVTNGSLVDVKILTKLAIEMLADTVIIAHNHPSGRLSPPEEDKKITKSVKEALSFFDIPLMDHFIIGLDREYFSFKQQGML